MKRISVITIIVTIIFAGILGCFLYSPIPRVNNFLPADELVTKYYTDEELRLLHNESDNYFCAYQNTSQLAKDFKIECLRNPAELTAGSQFRPYIVLLGTSGKKAFIMLDYPQKRNEYPIHAAIISDRFMSFAELEAMLNDLDSRQAEWDEWEELYSYSCGESNGNLELFFPLAVKEGVVSCCVYHSFSYGRDSWGELLKTTFYPDDTLFSENALANEFYANDIWPYLPIDKE